MSEVRVWKPVNDRIVQAALGSKDEIVGLLIGRLRDGAILIEDSVTGESTSGPHRVVLSSMAIAKIADAMMTGRLKGNIVGWYHSHTEGGLFFSETDIETQRKLQQFSALITGMVVDAGTGEVGYFRVDPQSAEALRIPADKVLVYMEPSEAISVEPKRPAPTPTIEVRRRAPERRQPTTRLIMGAVLVGLLASLLAVGLVLYGVQYGPKLAIDHAPIPSGTIGTPIEITASLTGPVSNVTLAYAPVGNPSATKVLMNQIKGVPSTDSQYGLYGYTIPGSDVTGNLAYYIIAFDPVGNKVSTSTYYVAIADFNVVPKSNAITVYRNSTTQFVTQLELLPVNSFNQQISLSTSGAPQGTAITFHPNPATPGMTLVDITITAAPTSPIGTASVAILATYLPAKSAPVIRQTTVAVTVADFGLQVSPASNQVSRGSTTTFTLTLTLQKGFVDPVTINVLGVPQGAKYQLSTTNVTSLGGGPGTTTVTLQITISTLAKPTTYPITITAMGGGVLHSQNVTLIVR